MIRNEANKHRKEIVKAFIHFGLKMRRKREKK